MEETFDRHQAIKYMLEGEKVVPFERVEIIKYCWYDDCCIFPFRVVYCEKSYSAFDELKYDKWKLYKEELKQLKFKDLKDKWFRKKDNNLILPFCGYDKDAFAVKIGADWYCIEKIEKLFDILDEKDLLDL